jgi:hypothetical protein
MSLIVHTLNEDGCLLFKVIILQFHMSLWWIFLLKGIVLQLVTALRGFVQCNRRAHLTRQNFPAPRDFK